MTTLHMLPCWSYQTTAFMWPMFIIRNHLLAPQTMKWSLYTSHFGLQGSISSLWWKRPTVDKFIRTAYWFCWTFVRHTHLLSGLYLNSWCVLYNNTPLTFGQGPSQPYTEFFLSANSPQQRLYWCWLALAAHVILELGLFKCLFCCSTSAITLYTALSVTTAQYALLLFK